MQFRRIKEQDSELYTCIARELERQRNKIELIASENFISTAVMEAMGNHLTNKYAEGYPGKRYYGGCEFVDGIEDLARERLKKLFGADHANVQPHSGTNANLAVYFTAVKPGDRVMGMDLSHGGHLTHGSPVNLSGKYFNFTAYGVDKHTERIDYNRVREIAKECRPKLLIAGATAYPRVIDFERLGDIAREVNALYMVDMAHIAGLVAAGAHPSPVPYADFITTTTHKTLRGPRGGAILCKAEFAKDIDKAVFPGTQGGPLMHIIAAKALSFKEAMAEEFKGYQGQIIKNAARLAKELTKRNLRLVSGGTDNHLLLIDLRGRSINGKEAEKLLDDIGITVNKNTVPYDDESPFITSGIRIGTPAVTTRGMKGDAMEEIADIIAFILDNREAKKEAMERVETLCNRYPLYEEISL